MLKIFNKSKFGEINITKSNRKSTEPIKETIKTPDKIYCSDLVDLINRIIDSDDLQVTVKNNKLQRINAEDKIKFNMLFEILHFIKYEKTKSKSIYQQIIERFLTNEGQSQFDELMQLEESCIFNEKENNAK